MKKTSTGSVRGGKAPEESTFELKSKIKDLEAEVTGLKQRLDDLRKAKNNLIVKREREVVQVGNPTLGRPPGVEVSKYAALEKKLQDAEQSRDAEEKRRAEAEKKLQAALAEAERERSEERERARARIEEAEREHEVALARMRAEMGEQRARADEARIQLDRLLEKLEMKSMQEEGKQHENSDRETYINELLAENAALRSKNDQLLEDLSVKEANWMQEEDKLKRKIGEQWDAKYAQWMSDTERKIDALRKANLELQSCLNRGNRREEGNATAGGSGEVDGSQVKLDFDE